MDLKLKDKVIMVAASSKGLGFGVADAVAREGARVSLASRKTENIQNAARKIRESSKTDARGYTFSASDPQTIRDWTAATLNDFGSIDGLVVNAGGPPPGKFDEFDDVVWANAFELTLMSAVRMIRCVLPTFRRKGSGTILTMTSTSIKEPLDLLLLSNVLRSGVVSLVKTLSIELAPEGIRINNIVPGRMDTDRVREIDHVHAEKRGIPVAEHKKEQERAIPLGRYGTIQEFGSAAAFLLSDQASYITGSTFVVDGGKTRTVW
jgi:3-oxoacyl-[acyl-carrier protein] reductase